jgi:hypothetical protein
MHLSFTLNKLIGYNEQVKVSIEAESIEYGIINLKPFTVTERTHVGGVSIFVDGKLLKYFVVDRNFYSGDIGRIKLTW